MCNNRYASVYPGVMSATSEPSEDRRTSNAATRRRQREREIIDATRHLFDDRGVRDAQIEDIAKAVGINRAIVYRHFTGKEELFALTLVQYLDELRVTLYEVTADTASAPPRDQLIALVSAFADYGIEHPAFVDCALALMRRSGDDLLAEVSESAMFRLGRAIGGCLALLTNNIAAGVEAGVFKTENPQLLSNLLYASGLGTLQLARVGLLVTEAAPGIPRISSVTTDDVRNHMVVSALAVAAGSEAVAQLGP